jgi:hypothetical protein
MLPATENLENPHSEEASKQTFLGQSPELVEQAGHVELMHCCKSFCTKTSIPTEEPAADFPSNSNVCH